MPEEDANIANDLLALRAMPELGSALRAQKEAIVQAWTRAVDELLPTADELTTRQVRDTLPVALGFLADALESGRREETIKLAEATRAHGISRFHQSYSIKDLILEYRLLRRIVIERLDATLGGLTLQQILALGMGIDILIQQGTTAFVDHQREQIEQANQAEGRFLAFLSHDLRNNLNHVILVLELHSARLIQLGSFKEEVEELKNLRDSIFKTIHGMERLLQVERLRRDTFHSKRESIDLHQLGREVLRGFEAEAAARGLTLISEIPERFTASTDRDVIHLVVQNLVGNAVKFSNKGTIRVAGGQEPDGSWFLTVSDQGPGIAPDQINRIFDAFTRGETHGKSGVGLGLSIASIAVKRLGGELTVDSTVGAGSTFRLRFPSEVS